PGARFEGRFRSTQPDLHDAVGHVRSAGPPERLHWSSAASSQGTTRFTRTRASRLPGDRPVTVTASGRARPQPATPRCGTTPLATARDDLDLSADKPRIFACPHHPVVPSTPPRWGKFEPPRRGGERARAPRPNSSKVGALLRPEEEPKVAAEHVELIAGLR